MVATSPSANALPLLGAALRRAAKAAGLTQYLRQRRFRMLLSIILTRSLHAFGFGLLVNASMSMLYKLVEETFSGSQQLPALAADAAGPRAGASKGGGGSDGGTLAPSADVEVQKGEEGVASPASHVPVRTVTPPSVHVRVQRAQTQIGTVCTLVDFFTGSFVGSFMDAYGRVPTMALGLAVPALFRIGLTWAPSLSLYFAYRVIVGVTGPAFAVGSVAALRDLYGRATPEFATANNILQRFQFVFTIAGTYTGRLLEDPRHGFLVCGVMQLSALVVLLTSVQETLPVRSKMQWSLRNFNPFSFFAFFGQSRALTALAVLSLFQALPGHINVHGVYRRQRFKDWGRSAESSQAAYVQMSSFLSTFVGAKMMDRLGFKTTTKLHSWFGVLLYMNSAWAPRMEMLFLNPWLLALMHGDTATSRCLQQEAAIVGAGQGALNGAEANMGFLPTLAMPLLFTRVYERFAESHPAAPYVLAAALHILSAEVVTPWAYRRLSPTVRVASLPAATRLRLWPGSPQVGRPAGGGEADSSSLPRPADAGAEPPS